MLRSPCWLLLIAFLPLAACKRDAPTGAAEPEARSPAGAAIATPPPTPRDLPASWPTGNAVTLTLAPDAGATSLTKALYERGDIVLEQTWPDGTRERWWHATDGSARYLTRDGTEHLEAAP